jgi:hypothetical protein
MAFPGKIADLLVFSFNSSSPLSEIGDSSTDRSESDSTLLFLLESEVSLCCLL